MNKIIVLQENIQNKIFMVRGKKVMLDRDLADLYGVETAHLKRQVKRNIDRFPDDFMFVLNKDEFENWRCQYGISNEIKKGLRYVPMAFTEHGILMLSSVLKNMRVLWSQFVTGSQVLIFKRKVINGTRTHTPHPATFDSVTQAAGEGRDSIHRFHRRTSSVRNVHFCLTRRQTDELPPAAW